MVSPPPLVPYEPDTAVVSEDVPPRGRADTQPIALDELERLIAASRTRTGEAKP